MENGKLWGIRTPKPLKIVTKFGVGDFVGNMTPHANIQTSGGLGVPANW